MDDLSRRLSAARRGAAPRRDLWPAVEARIRTRRSSRWAHAAAAAVLFVAGTVTGIFVERGTGAPLPAGQDDAGQPMYAAAAVQRAGSEYLAAVAALRVLGAGDEPMRAQGYEAALAVVSVTAQEVAEALDLRDEAGLADHARAARAEASERTAALMRAGGE